MNSRYVIELVQTAFIRIAVEADDEYQAIALAEQGIGEVYLQDWNKTKILDIRLEDDDDE